MLYKKLFYRARFPLFLLLFSMLGSFTSRAGGVQFSIYLNKQLLFTEQQYRDLRMGVKYLYFDQNNIHDVLYVHIRECGQPLKSRSIVLKDLQGNIIGKWTFKDEPAVDKMQIPVSEILKMTGKHSKKGVGLYFYGSGFFPDGFLLSSVYFNKEDIHTQTKSRYDFWDIFPGGLLIAGFIGLVVIRRHPFHTT